MGENPINEGTNEYGNEIGTVKSIADAVKKVGIGSDYSETEYSNYTNENGTGSTLGSEFKVATNLPAKPTVWSKIKSFLLTEISVELTPHQQKIENEINEFLHQEVTWQSFKSFLFQEVPVTYKGKRIF